MAQSDAAVSEAATVDRFDALFERFYADVFGLVYRVLGERMATEDCVQDTFVKLADRAALQTRPDAEVGAWLRRVALNLAFNRLRAERRAQARLDRVGRLEGSAEDADADPRAVGEGPSEVVLRAEERALVRQTLAELPERQRVCLLLRHSGYAYVEIAATLRVAPGSVGVLLARAEDAFRSAYRRTLLA